MTKIRNLVLLLLVVPTPAASQVAVKLVSRDEMLTPTASILALERSRRALLEARLAIDDALSEVDETLALLRAIESRSMVERGLVHAVRRMEEAPAPLPGYASASVRDFVAGILDALDPGRTARDLFVVAERRLSAGFETVLPILDRIRFAALHNRMQKGASLDGGPTLLTPCRSQEGSGQGVVAPFTAFEAPPAGLQAFEAREVPGSETALTSIAAPPPILSVPSSRSDPTHDEAIVRHALPDALEGPVEAREPFEPTLPAVERHLDALAPPER